MVPGRRSEHARRYSSTIGLRQRVDGVEVFGEILETSACVESIVVAKLAATYVTPPGSPPGKTSAYERKLIHSWQAGTQVMEQYDPTRRQYVPNTSAAQQSQQARAPSQTEYSQYGSPSSERFRQVPYLQQSPASATSAPRVGSDAQQMYGFVPGGQYGSGPQMQPSGIQYGQEMQAPDARRQYTQQYAQYGGNIMYGMPQAQPAQPAQSPYEQASQYRQRATPSSETAAAQFGVPQASQYYLAGQPGATNVVASEFATPNVPSQYQQPDPYPQSAPSSSQYAGAMMDPAQSAIYATYGQQPQYTTQAPAPSNDQGFDRYQAQIRAIFTFVQNDSLREIGGPLLEISQYLLNNVEMLGEAAVVPFRSVMKLIV